MASLTPLIIGSAVVPIQIIITILLIRASRVTALAWVAGMVTVRLVQGALFGLVWSSGDVSSADTGESGAGLIASTLLLVAALLFIVTAVKQLLHEDDPDAPPPKWLAIIEGLTPFKAFALGAGLLIIGIKFWVFTMSAPQRSPTPTSDSRAQRSHSSCSWSSRCRLTSP